MYIRDGGLERTKLELKYCECCGALWLRKQGSTDPTCGACVSLWADLPGMWIESLRRRPVVEWRTAAGKMRATAPTVLEGGVA
jgi:hypothetical protein